jgi:hypothetical protein
MANLAESSTEEYGSSTGCFANYIIIIIIIIIIYNQDGTRQRSSLRHYAASRKVAGSGPDEVDFSIYLILPAALWPWGRLSLYEG